MKRLGIFLVYDAHGIMDQYIDYLLQDIMQVLDDVYVVCNGFLKPSARNLLEKYAAKIIVRENLGFDFGAWKDAMLYHIGFNVIRQYDELVLFNDSFFGSFEGFKKVFLEMEEKQLDFWGLTVHGEVDTVKDLNPYGYRPRYIQTYFVAFQKRIINDYSFYNYWKDMPYFKTFLEAGEKGSAVLTKYFEDQGFTWGVYSDTTEYETTREKNVCNHAFNTLDIIKNKNYPIIKRKSFVLGKQRFLKYNSGLDLEKAVAYIEEKGNYDTELIYEHIIRRFNIFELKESMNLDFVLPTDKKTVDISDRKILVCAEIKSKSYLEYVAPYINHIEDSIDVALFVRDDNIEESIKSCIRRRATVEKISGSPGNMLRAAVTLKYEFICFISQTTRFDEEVFTMKNSYVEARWENILITQEYIANIIEIFDKRKYLGVLIPECTVNSNTYGESHGGWRQRFDTFQQIFENLEMHSIVEETVAPLLSDGAFWCRREAVSWGTDEKYDLLEELQVDGVEDVLMSIVPYIAQECGYFTGSCMNDRFAAALIESLKYMEREIYNCLGKYLQTDYRNFFSYRENVQQFVSKANKKGEIIKEVPVIQEVPVEIVKEVLVEIGVKGAVKNWIKKKFGGKKGND